MTGRGVGTKQRGTVVFAVELRSRHAVGLSTRLVRYDRPVRLDSLLTLLSQPTPTTEQVSLARVRVD